VRHAQRREFPVRHARRVPVPELSIEVTHARRFSGHDMARPLESSPNFVIK
jgi:hypothetical protein